MSTIAITGAAGSVPGQVLAALVEAGEPIVGLARGGAARSPNLPNKLHGRVEWRDVDFDDLDAVRSGLNGVGTLLLLTVGSNPEGIVARAREAGVNAVVLLSSQGAGTRPDAYRHARSFEDALTASGLAWTIVRPSGFASNTRMWASAIRERRAVFAPFGDVALPVIHPADIVETLVTILLSYRAPDATSKHMGRTYELTGPESVSPRQQTSAIARALGMEIEFIELTPDAARANLLRVIPEDVTDATLAVLGSPTVEESTPTHDVSEVLGRPSATFADWAAENRQAFG